MSLNMPVASLLCARSRAAVSLFSIRSSDTTQSLPPCLQTALTRLVRLGHIDHCGVTALAPNGAAGFRDSQVELLNTTVQFTEAVALSTSRMAVLDDLAALAVLAHPPALAHWIEDLLCYLERARATSVLSEGALGTLQRFAQLPHQQRRILAALLLAAVLCPSSCDASMALPLWVFQGEHTSLLGADNPEASSNKAAARPRVSVSCAIAAAVCRAAACEIARVDGVVDFNAAWEGLCAAGLVSRAVPKAAAHGAAVSGPESPVMRGPEGAAAAGAEPFFVRPDGSFSSPGRSEAPRRCCLPAAEGQRRSGHFPSSPHAPAHTATQMEIDVITVLDASEGTECDDQPQRSSCLADGGDQRCAPHEARNGAEGASKRIIAATGGAAGGHAAFDGAARAVWPQSASRHAPMPVAERADTVTPVAAGDGAAAAAGGVRWSLHAVQTAATALAAVAQQASAATASTAPKSKRARTAACEHAAAVSPPPFCLGSACGAVDPATSLAPLRAWTASAAAPALAHAAVAPAAARTALNHLSFVVTRSVPITSPASAVCSHLQCNPAGSLAASPPRIAAFFCIGRALSAGCRVSTGLRTAVAEAASLALSLSTTEYGLAHDFNLLFMRQMVLARAGLGRFALAGSPFAREMAKLAILQRGATGVPAGDVAAACSAQVVAPPALMRPWVYFPSSLAFAQYNAARAWQRRVLALTERNSMLQRLLVAMRGNADGQEEALARQESVALNAESAAHAWVSLLHRIVLLRLHLPSFTPAQAAAEDAATADGSLITALRWRQPLEPAATSGSPASAFVGSAAIFKPGTRWAAGPEEAPALLLAVQRRALNSATHAGPASASDAAAASRASGAAPGSIISYFSPFGATSRPVPPVVEESTGCSTSGHLRPRLGDASAVCPSPDAFCRESVQARCSPAPAVLKSCLYVVSWRPC